MNKSREVVATVSFLFYDDIMHKIENNNKVNKILHSHGILYRVLLPYAAYTILVLVFFFRTDRNACCTADEKRNTGFGVSDPGAGV